MELFFEDFYGFWGCKDGVIDETLGEEVFDSEGLNGNQISDENEAVSGGSVFLDQVQTFSEDSDHYQVLVIYLDPNLLY